MSNENQFLPPENNEPEQDPFARLDLFEHDPRFAQVLRDIEKLQAAYSSTSDDDIEILLEQLNERLYTIDWIGDRVGVTGKVRVAPWSQNNSFDNAYFKQSGLVFGEDEKGPYCEANDLPLIMALVDVDEDEHETSEEGRYVLTFHTPDALFDVQDEPEDVYTLKMNAGDFIVYPDDLHVMKFNTPSLEQIERTLELYYPSVYKEIQKRVAERTGRQAHRFLSDLQHFTLPAQRSGYDADTLGQIGRYLYDRIGIDSESDYRFVVNGPVGGMSIESGLIKNRTADEQHLSGIILAIDFEPETNELVFVVSELSSVGEGYELRTVPVEHVTKLYCVRPLQSRFGSIAMKNFNSSEDVKEYWNMQRIAKSQKVQSDDELLFSSVASIFEDIKDDYKFNEKGNFYELSLDDDMGRLIENYIDHLHAVLELHGESGDIANVNEMLMKDIESLNDISIDDVVATKHKAIVIEAEGSKHDGPVDFSINVLEGRQRIRGTFAALTVAQFPSEAMIEAEGRITDFKPSLGMVIKDATIFEDGASEDEFEKCDNEVIVMIAPSIGTKFVKIKEGSQE